jgi:hypothetical protein
VVTDDESGFTVAVRRADADGLAGGQWVELENTSVLSRPVISATTALVSIDSSTGAVEFAGAGPEAWALVATSITSGGTVTISSATITHA